MWLIVKLVLQIFLTLILSTPKLAIASPVPEVIKPEYQSPWALSGSRAPLSSQSSNQLP